MVEAPKITIGLKAKNILNTSIDVPGPGSYAPQIYNPSFSYTIGSKFELNASMNRKIPGPG